MRWKRNYTGEMPSKRAWPKTHIINSNGSKLTLRYLSVNDFFHTLLFSKIITNSPNTNFEIKIKSSLGTKPIKTAIIRCVSTISHNATENNNLHFLRFLACISISFPISLKFNQIPLNPLMIKLIQWQILGNKELSCFFISTSNW